jgi:hypothetical protein
MTNRRGRGSRRNNPPRNTDNNGNRNVTRNNRNNQQPRHNRRQNGRQGQSHNQSTPTRSNRLPNRNRRQVDDSTETGEFTSEEDCSVTTEPRRLQRNRNTRQTQRRSTNDVNWQSRPELRRQFAERCLRCIDKDSKNRTLCNSLLSLVQRQKSTIESWAKSVGAGVTEKPEPMEWQPEVELPVYIVRDLSEFQHYMDLSSHYHLNPTGFIQSTFVTAGDQWACNNSAALVLNEEPFPLDVGEPIPRSPSILANLREPCGLKRSLDDPTTLEFWNI